MTLVTPRSDTDAITGMTRFWRFWHRMLIRTMNATDRLTRSLSSIALLLFSISCASTEPVPNKGNVVAPKVVRRVEPLYPSDLRQARIEGSVIIAGTVPKEGGVLRDVRVVSSTDARFEGPALEAVSQWEWSPGTADGVAVDVEFTTTVRFGLKPPARIPSPDVRQIAPRTPEEVADLRQWSVEVVQDGRIAARSSSFEPVAEGAIQRLPFTIRVILSQPVDVLLNALPTGATFRRVKPGFDEGTFCAIALFPCLGTGLAEGSHDTFLLTGEEKTHDLAADPGAERWTRVSQSSDGWVLERDVTSIDFREIAAAPVDELYLTLVIQPEAGPLDEGDIRRVRLRFR